MTAVSLRPMTPEEYAEWEIALARDYAREMVEAGRWSAEGAEERARTANAASLPQGAETPRMLIRQGIAEDGTVVGRVWIGLDHPTGAPDTALLHDIEVLPHLRGRGWGRALLAAAEEAVREAGVGSLGLTVFRANPVAQRLYESAGYEVVTQQMRKRVGPDLLPGA